MLRIPAIAVMIKRLFAPQHKYSPQFWLILGGLLIGTIGSSMVFPFLTIYVSEQLDRPLTEVASLITLNGMVGLLNDNIGPKAIWYGGGLIGLASAASYAIMGVYYSPRNVAARKAAQNV